jgi:hypothetical protein
MQTSMPPVGFERTISVLERAKTVRALDRAVTAIGPLYIRKENKNRRKYQFTLELTSIVYSLDVRYYVTEQ